MKTRALLLLAALVGAPVALLAQESTTATPVPAPGAKAEPAQADATAGAAAQKVQAIVRGFYVQGQVGGGYMLKNAANVVDRGTYPQAPANEPLGPGSTVQMAVGYDLSDFLAIEALGGAALVSATSAVEPVRDLSMVFAGLGVRGAYGLSDRLHLTGSAAIAYVNADNDVEKASTGVAALVGVGAEYYVHVRHFSVGAELLAFVPFSPARVFIGIAPNIKYTF